MNQLVEPEVVIGRIVSPFGIKGEVKVLPETDHPEHLKEIKSFWLKPKGEPAREVQIESVRFHKNMALVKFEGIDDISAAEEMRGWELWVPAMKPRELSEGEYYIHDLVGLRVLTEDGEDLGEVTEVILGPANDVYFTDKAMIPALKDIVKKIDLEGGKMIVRYVPGMLKED